MLFRSVVSSKVHYYQGGQSEQGPAGGHLLYKTILKASLRTPSLGFRIDIRSRRCAIVRLRPLDISTPPKNGARGRTASSQREMGLDAQEQLAKGHEARDVQDGGRRKVVKLESVKLQEPPKKRMYGKSESPY